MSAPYFTNPKGSEVPVGVYFKSKEFDCPCSHPECATTVVSFPLAAKLDNMRRLLGAPLVITKGGGYRCKWYQEYLRQKGYETAKGVSQHELGNAADLESRERTGRQLADAARMAGFMAVGIAATWIHADTRPEHHEWFYASAKER